MKTHHSWLWYLAFDYDEDYKRLSAYLNTRQEGVGNDFVGLPCPDGKKRPAMVVSYDLVTKVHGVKGLNFKLLCRKTPDSKLQFWPPPSRCRHQPKSKKTLLKVPGISTATELSKKKLTSTPLPF